MAEPLSLRVAARYAYQKEKKKSKIERLSKFMRQETGISRGMADDIADAIIRNRDLGALAIQKGWPVEDGVIQGPSGQLALKKVREQLQ